MKTIEYRSIDKSLWPRGEWNDEIDKKQWQDKETGLPCLVKRRQRAGHFCGYVGVDRTHPFYEKQYTDIVYEPFDGSGINIQKELSYSAKCELGEKAENLICHEVKEGEPDDIWWFGFDCAKPDDLSPGPDCLDIVKMSGATYKNLKYVESNIKALARQLSRGIG